MSAASRTVLAALIAGSPLMAPRAQVSPDTTASPEAPSESGRAGHVEQVRRRSGTLESYDTAAFRYVYRQQGGAFTGLMRQVNSGSVRVFLAAPPLLALGAAATGSDLDPPARLASVTLGAAGTVYAIKALVRRERPYNALEGITARVHVPEVDPDPFSLPSGHAAVAFAQATSTTLSYPHWYVAAPAYSWAAATAVARVWHGVHYPSDILLGAAIGVGAAAVVHALLPEIDTDDGAESVRQPALTLRLALP